MNKRVLAFCEGIVNPITKNLVFFVSIFVISYLPSLIYWIVNYSSYLRLYALLAIPVIFALAYLLSCVVQLFGEHKRYVMRACYLLLGVSSLAEVFLILEFHTRFSALMFRLMTETNTAEIRGFVSSYVLSWGTFVVVTVFVALGCVIACAERKYRHRVWQLSNSTLCLLTGSVLFSTTLYVYRDVNFLPKFFAKNIDTVMGTRPIRYGTPYVSLGLMMQSAKIHALSLQDVELLAETLRLETQVLSHYEGDIVLVIGESYSKYHSSLYGYSLSTNPRLSQERANGNLYLFSDVVTPYNATALSLQKIFSFQNQDSERYWTTYQMFPKLFRQAGFKSLLISNQESLSTANDWDCANYYLVSPQTSPYLFDWHSSDIEQWDMDLILDNQAELMNRMSERNLIIYHLMGQHTGYDERCPDSERVFVAADYAHRKELPSNSKAYIAHYDNATLYNDKVVAAIFDQFRERDAIVIYLSDHGEEVFDYRDRMGRSHDPVVTHERAKYQFEVPFMIWMSDRYKENHPDMVSRIERSVNRPYMTDDLPHLMLDLAGIECEWFDPTRSVINDQFDASRKRLLLDSRQDYDAIMRSATE